jgi:hypothetical protein
MFYHEAANPGMLVRKKTAMVFDASHGLQGALTMHIVWFSVPSRLTFIG